MKRLLCVMLLVVLGGLYFTVPAFAASRTDRSDVTPELRVPEGQARVLSTTGYGVQIYDCVDGAWVFREPAAGIFEKGTGRLVAVHYVGPTWRSTKDGSSVVGTVVASKAAPNPGRDIPWLLLRSRDNTGGPGGVLGEVEYVQRLDTRGGVAPSGGCAAGTTAKVPYSATYDFWAPTG